MHIHNKIGTTTDAGLTSSPITSISSADPNSNNNNNKPTRLLSITESNVNFDGTLGLNSTSDLLESDSENDGENENEIENENENEKEKGKDSDNSINNNNNKEQEQQTEQTEQAPPVQRTKSEIDNINEIQAMSFMDELLCHIEISCISLATMAKDQSLLLSEIQLIKRTAQYSKLKSQRRNGFNFTEKN